MNESRKNGKCDCLDDEPSEPVIRVTEQPDNQEVLLQLLSSGFLHNSLHQLPYNNSNVYVNGPTKIP
jgi:hypothetical protein